MNYRVKYWRWINEQAGEWYRTGLMTKENAEKVAESFRQSHEQVEVYYDDDGKKFYLVKWQGYKDSYDWLPKEDLEGAAELVFKYDESIRRKQGKAKRESIDS